MKDELSALLDDNLDDFASGRVCDSLRRDPELRSRWRDYCLIGDSLRGDIVGAPDFSERVMQQIRSEPTLLAPVASAQVSERARDLWHSVMPLAASVMGVAAVGWVAMSMYASSDDSALMAASAARAQAVEQVARQSLTIVNDDRADSHQKYLFVHQAMNGGGPIPGAIQYVRTVSADVAGDSRR